MTTKQGTPAPDEIRKLAELIDSMADAAERQDPDELSRLNEEWVAIRPFWDKANRVGRWGVEVTGSGLPPVDDAFGKLIYEADQQKITAWLGLDPHATAKLRVRAERLRSMAGGPDQPPLSGEADDKQLIDVATATKIWPCRGESWWRANVGEEKEIPQRDSRGNAKLFYLADAEKLAARLGFTKG